MIRNITLKGNKILLSLLTNKAISDYTIEYIKYKISRL